ncbi:MAG TPA: phosphatidate cytidylyltransferase, partial [Polyangia bacterium]
GFGALVMIVAALALNECAAIMLPGAPAKLRGGVVTVGVAFAAALYLAPSYALPWTLAALVVTAALTLMEPGEIPGAGVRLSAAVFSVLYVGGLAAPLALLQRDADHGRAWVLLAIGVTFGNDTGAYFAGRGFGKHKLYPKVSPAKTVEGAVGGLVAALIILFAVRATLCPWLTIVDVMAAGLPAALLGPVGDLCESLMKRAAGVKDSGHLIPGHGGMLDRIDALLFVGAWIYVYAVHLR